MREIGASGQLTKLSNADEPVASLRTHRVVARVDSVEVLGWADEAVVVKPVARVLVVLSPPGILREVETESGIDLTKEAVRVLALVVEAPSVGKRVAQLPLSAAAELGSDC